MAENNATGEIATGVETTNERLKTSEWDLEAFADDGEFAMCWLVRRTAEDLVESQAVVCEAGLRESHGPVDVYDIDPETPTRDWARDHADADPEEAVRLAREHLGQ